MAERKGKEREVWCYASGNFLILLEVGSFGTGNDEREEKSSNTAETGEETFGNRAARTAVPSDCASGVQGESTFHV